MKDEKITSYSKTAQVGLLFPSQNLQGSRLADTVLANQTQHFSRTWDGQPMQLERVLGVAMSCVLLQVRWDVDNGNCIKGTFLLSIKTVSFQTSTKTKF